MPLTHLHLHGRQMCRVELKASATELPSGLAAGSSADIIGFDPETGQYTVRAGDGDKDVSVPPESVRLPTDATGIVTGLQGAAEHNGKSGCIVGFDDDADRYIEGIVSMAWQRTG